VFGSDWAVASTGVAGPDRQEGHAVGTVFVAVEGPDVRRGEALRLTGERNVIRTSTVAAALTLLASALSAEIPRREAPRGP
jgi:nicotinamide-nucleotide amidase